MRRIGLLRPGNVGRLKIQTLQHMKNKITDKIRLSGTVNGARFEIGVIDPYTLDLPVKLGPKHLRVLRSFLLMLDMTRLNEPFVVNEDELARRLPMPDGVDLLKDVLWCWAIIKTKEVAQFWTFATVWFCEKGGRRSMHVRLNDATVDLFRKLMGMTTPQTVVEPSDR